MPIDPRIALGYQPPQQQSPMNIMAQMQALQNARQENAMRQAQMENYASEVARRNALLPVEMQEARAKVAKEEAARKKGEHELAVAELDRQMDHVALVNNQAGWTAWRNGVVAKDPSYATYIPEEFTPENKVSALSTAKFARDQIAKDLETTNVSLGGTTEGITRTGKTMWSRKETLKPGEAERDAETRRHNVETERAATDRLAFDREKMGAGGEIDAKEKSKREAAYPKVSGAYRAATHEIDSLITDIEALRKHSGLSGITGLVAGRTPNVTGPARQAQAILDRVLAKGQFRGLQAMREASPTGGALGNISDKEGAALRAAFGALNQTQDTKDFKTALDNVLSDLKFSKGNIDQTYADTYAYKGGNTPAAAPPALATDHSKKSDAEILAELGVKP